MDFAPILRQYDVLLNSVGKPLETNPVSLAVTPLAGGLINDTFGLGATHILQRLHSVFAPRVNLDIAILTDHLRTRGVPVPRLSPTRDGRLWVEIEGHSAELDGVWRIMTRLSGRTLHRVASQPQAEALGNALGQFHGALVGFGHTFHFTRPGAHDTQAHMEALEVAVATHKAAGHRLVGQIEPLARRIVGVWGQLCSDNPDYMGGSRLARLVHGDPKVSNFLFDVATDQRISGIVDLDTMAHATLDVELGDAVRSWCSSADESSETVSFSVDRFQAAMEGYVDATQSWLLPGELRWFGLGAERICLELSARFAADALNESYFGWDPAVAPGRGEHNLRRAINQFAMAQAVGNAQGEMKQVLGELGAGL